MNKKKTIQSNVMSTLIGNINSPHNLEAEKSLLGCFILDNSTIDIIIDKIGSDYFYSNANTLLFDKIVEMREKRIPIDNVTLFDYLNKNKGDIEKAGGIEYVASLASSVPTAVNVEYYANIVKEKAIVRKLIDVCNSILIEASAGGGENAALLLDKAESEIMNIARQQIEVEQVEIGDILTKEFEKIIMKREQDSTPGLLTHYYDLDEKINGFLPGQLIIIAGRPSMGKTSLALNIIENVVRKDNVPVALFSLEMAKEMIAINMVCSFIKMQTKVVQSPKKMPPEEFNRLVSGFGEFSDLPIYIDDSTACTPLELRAKARRMKSEFDIGLIVVDYIQLMEIRQKRTENRQQEIATISRSLKSLARELKIPIIVLSQLNRASEARGGKPRLSDLRESGAIEQDADIVILLWRPERNSDDPSLKGKAILDIAKQRTGMTGEVNLTFIGEYMRFENMAKQHFDS